MEATTNLHSRRFVGNAAISTVLHFSSVLVTLAATPYILWRLGLEGYGFWALLNTVIRYSLAADIGIAPSVTKHVAQFVSGGDRSAVRETTTIGMLYFAWVALIGMAAAMFGGPMLLSHLPLAADLRTQAPGLLTALMGSVALNFVFWGSQGATLTGYGRARETAAINAAGQVVFAITAVLFLCIGRGLPGLVEAAYAQVLTMALLGYICVKRIDGAVFINPLRIRKSLFRNILTFGGWLQVSTVCWIVISDTPAVLVGYVVGLEYVGLLDIATRLARVVKALGYNFSTALLPAISALNAESGSAKIASFLPQAMRLLAFIALISTGAIVGSSPLLLNAWLGSPPAHKTLILIVLAGFAMTYAIEMMTNAARTAACGLGKPWLDAMYTLTYAVLALSLSIGFVRAFGLAGVALAAFLGAIGGSIVFFVASSGNVTLRFTTAVRGWLPGLLSAVLVATCCAWSAVAVFLAGSPSRLTAGMELVAVALIYGGSLLVALRIVRFFSSRDLDALRSVLPYQLSRWLDTCLARRFFAVQ